MGVGAPYVRLALRAGLLVALGEGFPGVLMAARSGAEWAWTALFRDLSPSVLGYLRSRGAAEPEDLASEAFLQVARDLPSFDGGEAEFRSWVFVIVHHRFLDERRYRGRHPSDPAAPESMVRYSPKGDVEEEALKNLATERVVKILSGLSETQRDVLMLRMVATLTVDEIARVVGKKPDSVKAIQRRGVAALRKNLARDLPPLESLRR